MNGIQEVVGSIPISSTIHLRVAVVLPPSEIVVVTGLPRAGTSLVMQVLAAGGVPVLTDGVRAPDAHNPRGYYELEAVRRTREDPSWIEAARGRAVKVVHALVPALPAGPEYRVILVRRRLDEVVASQERMLAGQGRPAGAELAPEAWAERLGRDLDRVESWLAAADGFRVLAVEHRELVTAAGPVVEAIARFVGGGLDTEAMARAVAPELYRVRR